MAPGRKTSIGLLVAAAVLLFVWRAGRFSGPPQRVEAFPAKPLPAVLPEASSSASFHYLRVPIFVYHSVAPYRPTMSLLVRRYTVSPDYLDQQLHYLQENGYTVISFESLVNAMTSESVTLPSKAVVLTFDDGWEDLYRQAFPILTKYSDTATFFIFTNSIGYPDFMTWGQLATMQAAGMDIESHSVSHPDLPAISDKAELWNEIEGSREIIASHLGRSPDIFAYPYGAYNDLDIALLKAAGYRAARTDLGSALRTLPAFAATKDELYKLPGIQVTNNLTRFLSLIKE